MKRIIKNQTGMSLMEIVVATALAAGIAIVGMKMMESSKEAQDQFSKSSDAIEIDKMIANQLLQLESCQQLRGLTAADKASKTEINIKRVQRMEFKDGKMEMVLHPTEIRFGRDKEIGKTKINYIRVIDFQSLESSGLKSGIITLEVRMVSKNKQSKYNDPDGPTYDDKLPPSRTYLRTVMVPVGLDNTGAALDCHLEKTDMYSHMVETLCKETFFIDTTQPKLVFVDPPPPYCQQAMLEVEKRVKNDICLDVTGNPLNASGTCDFYKAHTDQPRCKQAATSYFLSEPAHGIRGFGAGGVVECIEP